MSPNSHHGVAVHYYYSDHADGMHADGSDDDDDDTDEVVDVVAPGTAAVFDVGAYGFAVVE